MSRKSIREQQISEYLSQDSRRSSLVADMIKKGVSRFEPVVDPMQREQLNMLDIKNVGEYINQFKIKLTEKLNLFDTILHSANMLHPDFATNVDKISNYISDMIDFNKIVQVYLNPSNTPQTRQEIMNKITQFKPNFEKLQKLTEDILKKDDYRKQSANF